MWRDRSAERTSLNCIVTRIDADFVIVGAGSAGCVLANRLSASGKLKVVLLEAGGSDLVPWIRVPIGYGKSYYDPGVNWKYETLPEPALGGQPSYWPRGKLLGGSSGINAMVYVRGATQDYDDWARGAPGWDWQTIEPYFRRLERWQGPLSQARGTLGPLAIKPLDEAAHPTCEAFLRAGEEFGLARNPDYNAGDMHGVALFQHTIEDGVRASTAHAYLRPAKPRSNLSVLTQAQATRIEFSGKRATDVICQLRGRRLLVRASRDIILSAGAINSPQLLELSGVGDSERLRALGIRITRHHGSVGEHLQDHLGLDHLYRARVPTLNQELAPWRGKLWSALRYAFTRQGPLALSVNQGGGFVSLDDRDSRPDLQLYYSPLSYTRAPATSRPLMSPDPFPGFLLGFNPCRPTSRGSTHIRSANPFAAPAIRPNYLSTAFDRQQMLAGARMLRKFAAMPSLAAIIDEELRPGGGPLDNQAMWKFIAANAWSVFHPCGSCRMGDDPETSVVDPRLRVHGLDGLRVVDASIFPSLPSGNTNAPVIVTAERAADLILADQRAL